MSEVVSIFHRSRCHPSSFRWVTFYILVFLTISARSDAQFTWKLLGNFNVPIGCGYFFDENHGLIGTGIRLTTDNPCNIYRTTDGGAIWYQSTVPAQIGGAVTRIWMIDSLNGYASILSSYSYPPNLFSGSALWETTDGGVTWFDPFHFDHEITDVYAQNGLMVVTKWDAAENAGAPDQTGGNYSYDNGKTWTENFRRCDGIAFSDSLDGVVTEMNQTAPGNNFWVTNDAGRTWQPSISNQYESWSIHALPNSGIYLCSNESQPNASTPYSSINWSTDGGFTWSARYTFPIMHFTGTVNGVGPTLYFQTDQQYYQNDPPFQHGMYRSDDTGATWRFVGGPLNSRDTRFVVTGCMGQVVYAFDGTGNVYKTTDGGDGTLHGSFQFTSDTILWEPNPCGDTLPIDVFGTNCMPVTIDSFSVPASSLLLSVATVGTLPQTLVEGDSAGILLSYASAGSGSTVTMVTVYGHAGTVSLTKSLTIKTIDMGKLGLALSKDSARLIAGSCAIAQDSVLLTNLACPGMVLDSVILASGRDSGETSVINAMPDSIPNNGAFALGFLFNPDSSGTHALTANVYAHVGRRVFDTTIAIYDSSFQTPASLTLDTFISIGTKYCKPTEAPLFLIANTCDSLTIDSVVSSNGVFSVLGIPGALYSGMPYNMGVVFNPDSAGTYRGTIRIYAHSRSGRCDTVLSVTAQNVSLAQVETLSDTALTFATSGCQSAIDTLVLGNQGCQSLTIDSVLTTDDSEIAIRYDSALVPVDVGDSVPIHIVYNPQNGISKTVTLRVVAHTPNRAFDTVISLALSNAIPPNPLVLSTDSLFLFTKYCQPVSLPLTWKNLGCEPMTLDSIAIAGDARNEFSVQRLGESTLPSGGMSDSCLFQFQPDSTGTRTLQATVYLHDNGAQIDTTLSISAENLTAPVPYIPLLPSLPASDTLKIPVMIEPTTDTFSIHSYAFHLAFNTDLLTPVGLDFSGVCDENIDSSRWMPEPGSGVSGRVWVKDTISDSSKLNLPLVNVLAKVSVMLDSVTPVMLDTFVTDREPAMVPCTLAEQTFAFTSSCGDPLLLEALRSETLSFDFVSLAPNPAHNGNWNVDYLAKTSLASVSLDVYTASGSLIAHIDNLPGAVGEYNISVPIPPTSGDYIIVLGNASEQTARKASVEK